MRFFTFFLDYDMVWGRIDHILFTPRARAMEERLLDLFTSHDIVFEASAE